MNIILIPLLLLTSFLEAQPVSYKNDCTADKQIYDFMQKWNIKGGSAAITKNGELIYNKGFGFSDQNNLVSSKPSTLYRLASVSKPITSIAIMKLIEDGRLAINDRVFGKGKILDQPYYLKAVKDERIYSITVKNLLEHTAGWDREIPADGQQENDPPFFPLHVAYVMEEPNPVGDSTLIKYLLCQGLNNIPGKKFAYSNVGYLILGKVIEKISGMAYEKYVRENIFDPLSIPDIHLGKNLFANKLNNESEYFSSSFDLSCCGTGAKVPSQYGGFNVEAMNAHGGWIASAPDLTKLLLALDGLNTSQNILSQSTIAQMVSPCDVNPHYAKGWSVNSDNNRWHTGSMDGTASFICITHNGYTWAFLFNSRGDNSAAFWKDLDRLPWNCINKISQSST